MENYGWGLVLRATALISMAFWEGEEGLRQRSRAFLWTNSIYEQLPCASPSAECWVCEGEQGTSATQMPMRMLGVNKQACSQHAVSQDEAGTQSLEHVNLGLVIIWGISPLPD